MRYLTLRRNVRRNVSTWELWHYSPLWTLNSLLSIISREVHSWTSQEPLTASNGNPMQPTSLHYESLPAQHLCHGPQGSGRNHLRLWQWQTLPRLWVWSQAAYRGTDLPSVPPAQQWWGPQQCGHWSCPENYFRSLHTVQLMSPPTLLLSSTRWPGKGSGWRSRGTKGLRQGLTSQG